MTTLRLHGIGVTHDGVAVLDDLDLTVPSSRVTALLGPSGSGKTTLLRIVGGLRPPTSGRVLLDEVDVTRVPSSDRDLSYVPQGAPLLPDRDLAHNLAFPLRIRGVARGEAVDTAEEHGRRFGLGWLRGRVPAHLSSGERAAAGIAKGTIRAPRVLLLDEPVPHLDPRSRASVLHRIGEFQRQHGVTVLLATNDVRVAEVLADHVAVIDRRRIVCTGTLAEVRRQPGTTTAADLLAPAPLTWLPAVVDDGVLHGQVRLTTRCGVVHVATRDLRDHRGPVLLGVGQRDGVLAPSGTGSLTGRARRLATTGDRRLVTMAMGDRLLVVDSPRDRWLPAVGEVADLDLRAGFVATPDGTILTRFT